MQTLASILAGLPADPTQVNSGIAPLVMQDMMAQQLAPGQLGNGAMPQNGQQMPPGQLMPGQSLPPGMMPQTGLGSLGATALPTMGGY